MGNRAKVFISFFFIWMVLAGFAFGLGMIVFNPSNLNNFESTGIAINGKVTALEPQNHQTVHYTYSVNEIEYSGSGGAGSGNPPFQELHIGNRVIVVCNPDNPGDSIMGFPQRNVGAKYSAILVLTILFPIVSLIVIYGIYKALTLNQLKTTAGQ